MHPSVLINLIKTFLTLFANGNDLCPLVPINLDHSSLEMLQEDFNLSMEHFDFTNIDSLQVPTKRCLHFLLWDPEDEELMEKIGKLGAQASKWKYTVIFEKSSNIYLLEKLFNSMLEGKGILIRSNGYLIFPICPQGGNIRFGAGNAKTLSTSETFENNDIKCSFLLGKTLSIAAFGVQPYVIFNGRTLRGVDMDIMNILSKKLKFNFEIHWGRSFGSRNATTGKWSGIVGEVFSGHSDLAIGALIATDLDRNKLFQFTASPYPIEFVLIAQHPEKLEPYLNLLKPFEPLTWISLGFMLLLVMITLILMDKAEIEETKHLGVWNTALLTYKVIVDQGLGKLNKNSHSFKIMLGIWLLASQVLAFAYSGNLNAYLVTEDYERSINTEEDVLILQRTVFLPVRAALYTSVATSPVQSHQMILKNTLKNDGLYSISRGWLTLEKEKEMLNRRGVLLFLKEPLLMRHSFLQKEYGDNPFRIGHKVIFSYSSGFMMSRTTPFKSEIDRELHYIVASGLIDKLRKGYYPVGANLKTKSEAGKEVILNMKHVIGPILVLAICLCLSFPSFVVELFLKPNQKSTELNSVISCN